MKEDKKIAKYVERIKASVSAIRASRGKIEDTIVVSKENRTPLPIYAIRVLGIQEMRCDPNNKINLDALVGRLTTFELDNYDNCVPSLAILNLHLKPSYCSGRKLLKANNLKVKKKTVLTTILKPLNPYLQEDIPKANESTKVNFL